MGTESEGLTPKPRNSPGKDIGGKDTGGKKQNTRGPFDYLRNLARGSSKQTGKSALPETSTEASKDPGIGKRITKSLRQLGLGGQPLDDELPLPNTNNPLMNAQLSRWLPDPNGQMPQRNQKEQAEARGLPIFLWTRLLSSCRLLFVAGNSVLAISPLIDTREIKSDRLSYLRVKESPLSSSIRSSSQQTDGLRNWEL